MKETKKISRKEYIRDWRKNNPDKVVDARKKFKENNPEKEKEYQKKYNKSEKAKERLKKYYESEKGKANLERKKLKRRELYQKNKDEINRKRRERNKLPEVKEKLRKENKRWREDNPEKTKEFNRKAKKKYDSRVKRLVFEHYGKKCACCGEDIEQLLTIDHINGGGTIHRKKINNQLYRWLVINRFPKGFQTLCFNCNWGKHINGGVCPHKEQN